MLSPEPKYNPTQKWYNLSASQTKGNGLQSEYHKETNKQINHTHVILKVKFLSGCKGQVSESTPPNDISHTCRDNHSKEN